MKRFKVQQSYFALFILILSVLLIAGCGSGGGGGADSGGGGHHSQAGTGAVCTGADCVDIGAIGDLGAAAGYVILTKAGASTVPNSVVTGNVGVSPAARGSLTDWSETYDVTDTYATSAQVVAPYKLYADDLVGGTTKVDLGTAVLSMEGAYTDAAGKAPAGGGLITACPGAGAFDGTVVPPLAAGVYTCAVNVTIPTNFTLNGSATDVWVFQITGTLTQSSATEVLLTGGALPQNVFWQVSGDIEIGTTAHMEGVILAQTAIHLRTNSSINGRLLAQTAVTLDQATVTQP
jgi:hypothetical protein